MGMTMEDARTVLTNATVDNPKGSIDGPKQSYTIYANDQLTKAEPYDNIIIGYRNGAAIRIGDIGHAVDGPQNRELAAWTNGKRAVLLLVFKQANADVISTADGVKARLRTLANDIPSNIHLSVVSDRTLTIRASVYDVEFTLILAIVLVVMVMVTFLFLRNLWATITGAPWVGKRPDKSPLTVGAAKFDQPHGACYPEPRTVWIIDALPSGSSLRRSLPIWTSMTLVGSM